MNKRIRAIIYCGAIVLTIAGIVAVIFASFSHRKHTPILSENTSSAETDLSEFIPPINSPVFEGKDIKGSPFVGEFKNTYVALYFSDANDVFANKGSDAIPKITINEDGSFTLIINAYDAGMVAVKGTVEVDGASALFTITAKPSVSYLGDDVNSFSLRLLDSDDLRYAGEQIGTITKGDLFSRV